ncbi:GNAT family N-acetyltransferase [Woeseia oceani]|uniref:Acetyltransferase n=1 Tax=Woeseia oceani TaxID=1548547 RepID=A0A193LI60_9GAMM|nr:GNAT family N-acetyltransferase [Woeseia oceani]ANO52128.1 acetyltransferase [Woeseia oceani]
MNISIRRASLDNVAGVAKLFDAYRVFYKQKSDPDLALQFLTDRLGNAESVIFFAEDESGNYLGFTQLFATFSSVSAERMWILNDLYVDSAARGHGVGTRLMNAARDHSIESGAKGLTLSTATDNTTAQSLYETLGYERDTEFYSYYLATPAQAD